MTGSLSDREQKLLAAGLLVFAVAAVWFAVVAPLKAGFDARRDRRDAAMSQLRHDQRLIAAGAVRRVRLSQTRKAALPLTLNVRDRAAAARMAQVRIARAAAASGVKLVATRATLAVRPLVRVEVDLKGDYTGLASLLQRLEGDVPAAQVDHLLESRSEAFQDGTVGPAALDAHLSLTYAYRPAD